MKTFNRNTTISFIAGALFSMTAALAGFSMAASPHAASDTELGTAPPVCATGFKAKGTNPQSGYKCVSKKLKCNAGLVVLTADYKKNRNKFVYQCGKLAG